MIRSRELKILFGGQNQASKFRVFSAQAVKATSSNFQKEWDDAKPYESIPAMTKLGAIRNFMPGGEWSINKRER
jgi:hypothetical protein